MIPIAQPLLGLEEAAAVMQVLASGQLAQSQQVAAFEHRFAEMCCVKEAIAVSSGTAALYLALLAHEIGPGDEVITTAFSFAATANVILQVGATPIFVDIEPDTYTIDPVLVKMAITTCTKAILPVHLYGHPCEMKQLERIASEHHLVVIEDACQAHYAAIDGKPVGSFGTGCFSFYATKNITTGEGGIVTTNDPIIAERIRLARNHGQKERYSQIAFGYNYRMTEMQAAIGLAQLEKLEHFTKQRVANAAFLTHALQGKVQTPVTRPGYRHVYHQYTIQISQNRDVWIKQLYERGVSTAIHYPTPIYQQPFYQENREKFSCRGADQTTGMNPQTAKKLLPVTNSAAQQVLSLPVHPALTEEDLITIAREVLTLCH